MPTPVKLDTAVLDPDRVSLLIGGRVHRDWNRYDIDSDLLTPADAWQVTLGLPDGQFPPQVTPGAPVEVRVGTDTVMSGRIDEIRHALARGAKQPTAHAAQPSHSSSRAARSSGRRQRSR